MEVYIRAHRFCNIARIRSSKVALNKCTQPVLVPIPPAAQFHTTSRTSGQMLYQRQNSRMRLASPAILFQPHVHGPNPVFRNNASGAREGECSKVRIKWRFELLFVPLIIANKQCSWVVCKLIIGLTENEYQKREERKKNFYSCYHDEGEYLFCSDDVTCFSLADSSSPQ